MTDRELLEFAAKAAGYIIEGTGCDGDKAWVYQLGDPLSIEGDPPIFLWDPIHNDGDALRLAVKLKLHVINDGMTCVCRTGMPRNIGVIESLSGCQYEATRRAIVRAAAEIGKAME